MSAQAMRASLFASAIAATFVGFVESSLASHGRCFVPRIFAILITERAPAQKRLRRYRSPCLVILPSLSLPPLEFCFGTSPIHAEKSRPDRKAFGSATVATKAVASAGPTPGISSRRRLVSFDRCQALIRRSNSRICALSLKYRGCVRLWDLQPRKAVLPPPCGQPAPQSRAPQDRRGSS